MTASLPDDTVLVGRLGDHDEAAFTLVVDVWSAGMIRLARSFVTTDDSAQEVVQDTWLAVWSATSGRSSDGRRCEPGSTGSWSTRPSAAVSASIGSCPITATIALLAHFSVDTVLPHRGNLTGHAAFLEGPSHSEVSDARRQDFQ